VSPMPAVPSVLHTTWAKALVALALVLGAPGVAGSLGDEELHVVANAPDKGEALSVLLSAEGGVVPTCDGEATVEVVKDGFAVYRTNAANSVDMDGCEATLEIPYDRFADENGDYTVRASYDDRTTETVVTVEKVVNYVFVRAFPNQDEHRTRVEVAFEAAEGSPLRTSIFGSGTLELDVRWEECADRGLQVPPAAIPSEEECEATESSVFFAEIPVEQKASTHVVIPWENLDADRDDDGRPEEGSYNVTAIFHNDAAKHNYNVPMDSTAYDEDPPATWFEVEY